MNSAPCAPRTVGEAMRLLAWAAGDDHGASSAAIFTWMTGLPSAEYGADIGPWAPGDLDDFGRCSRLVAQFPQFRPLLPRMKKISSDWRKTITNWNALEACLAADDWGKARELLP